MSTRYRPIVDSSNRRCLMPTYTNIGKKSEADARLRWADKFQDLGQNDFTNLS